MPLMLLSGGFASQNNFAPYLKPLEYISGYKYSYQILTHNEFYDIQPLNCSNGNSPLCNPLNNIFSYPESMKLSFILMGAVCFCFQALALFIMSMKY